MDNTPSPESKKSTSEPPAPEELKPQTDNAAQAMAEAATANMASSKAGKRPRHGTYRPSHKATFIGLAVIVAILALNAGIIAFVIKSQSKNGTQLNQDAVTISPSTLEKLGVNRSSVGHEGVELVVNPDARFNGELKIGGDVSIAGQLQLNNRFSASDANFAKFTAGGAALNQLNVNGDATLTNLNVRKDLVITGVTRMQGSVTMTQLLTVNNSINVSGNLAVGGLLSVNGFHTSSLVVDSTVTIGGHVITRGLAPSVSRGGAVGNNGTVSISGNDMSGTVAVNIGTGATSGILANVSFRSSYSNTPHVVVTPIGAGIGSAYINRSASGFSIGVNSPLAPGGYAFDYIVEQ